MSVSIVQTQADFMPVNHVWLGEVLPEAA